MRNEKIILDWQGPYDTPTAAAEAAFKHKGGPCNYTSGGLFCINRLFITFDDGGKKSPAFEFAGGAA